MKLVFVYMSTEIAPYATLVVDDAMVVGERLVCFKDKGIIAMLECDYYHLVDITEKEEQEELIQAISDFGKLYIEEDAKYIKYSTDTVKNIDFSSSR